MAPDKRSDVRTSGYDLALRIPIDVPMIDLIFSDQVRALAAKLYLDPGGAEAEIAIRAGDVHKAIGYRDRLPLVVSALKAKVFRQQYGLELIRMEGVPQGASTTFVFRRVEQVAPLPRGGAAWAEVTSSAFGHGGLGWELGRWLWSPTTSKDGAQRYAVMELPQPGDQVFHLVAGVSAANPRQRVMLGASRVAASAERTVATPPLPGAWEVADEYFRIRLEGFREFSVKLPMDAVEAELSDVILSDLLERPKYYPYAPYRDGFRGAQGIYLTKLTPTLAEAFREISGVVAQPGLEANPEGAARAAVQAFAEGERARRETHLFKRNPALRAAAIAKHGLRCFGCKHALSELYGPLGEGYIEIHHLDPLGEGIDSMTPEAKMTTVDDVAPLCPSCHRMIHRRRPALTLDQLRLALASARTSDQPVGA